MTPHVPFSQTCHRPLLHVVVCPPVDVAAVLLTTDSSQKGEKAAHSTSTTPTCVARQLTITGSVCTPISDRSGWPPHGYSRHCRPRRQHAPLNHALASRCGLGPRRHVPLSGAQQARIYHRSYCTQFYAIEYNRIKNRLLQPKDG